jgi:hypothetical protein
MAPFIETKEVVGGYLMIQVKSKQQALREELQRKDTKP